MTKPSPHSAKSGGGNRKPSESVFGGKKKGLKLSMPLASQYEASLRLGANSPWAKLKPSRDQDGPAPCGSKNPFPRPASDPATWNTKDRIAYDKWIKFESTIRKLSVEEAAYFK